MGSNDPVLETVGLTHLGSPKALVGKRGGPLLREFREFALRGNLLDMAVHRHKGVSQYLVLQVPNDDPDRTGSLAVRSSRLRSERPSETLKCCGVRPI